MNQVLIGFTRGLAYAVIGAIALYVEKNLGASGLVSGSVATFIVGLAGLVDHALLPTP